MLANDLGTFCFAQKLSVIEEVIHLLRIMLCYQINVNEQIEFHTLINSQCYRSLWLMNYFKDKDIEAVNVS